MVKRAGTVGARELKTRLGAHLRRVREGVTLVVTDRGRPVAELRPIAATADGVQARLAELESLGVVTRGADAPRRLPAFRPVVSRGASVQEALFEDREDRF